MCFPFGFPFGNPNKETVPEKIIHILNPDLQCKFVGYELVGLNWVEPQKISLEWSRPKKVKTFRLPNRLPQMQKTLPINIESQSGVQKARLFQGSILTCRVNRTNSPRPPPTPSKEEKHNKKVSSTHAVFCGSKFICGRVSHKRFG